MYDSPITLYESFDIVFNEATKKRNKAVMAEIKSRIAIDIDEKALTQALMQDKERYEEAYRRGYQDGKFENDRIVEDIREQLKEILNENETEVK